MRRNNDPRDHYYLTRCVDCPQWVEHMDCKPIAAERAAHKHAKRHAGHQTYVVDVNALRVTCRYRFEAMLSPPSDDVPF